MQGVSLDADDVARLARNAVSVREGRGNPGIILLNEHGGRGIPSPWGTLGLPEPFLETHFAGDLGSSGLTLMIAELLDATAIISNYSRLFLDYNRKGHDPQCMRSDMGGIPIPGNLDLSDSERSLREQIARHPVEAAVAHQLEGVAAKGKGIISIHSFSPVWEAQVRACQIGIMWKKDSRLSEPLLKALRRDGTFATEDNQPYSFAESDWFTLDRHGLSIGIPNAYIEIRNDLLSGEEAILKMARTLASAIKVAFEAMSRSDSSDKGA